MSFDSLWPRKQAELFIGNEAYTTKEAMLEAVYASAEPELWDWLTVYVEAAWREAERLAEDHFVRIAIIEGAASRRAELARLEVPLRHIVKEKLRELWERRKKNKQGVD